MPKNSEKRFKKEIQISVKSLKLFNNNSNKLLIQKIFIYFKIIFKNNFLFIK